MANLVQFRWVDKDQKVHILDQFKNDWRFNPGDIFEFWGGRNEVVNVRVMLHNGAYGDKDGMLSVTQIVTVKPLWGITDMEKEMHSTPEECWGNTAIVGEY